MSKNIVLTGFMGAGKSMVAAELSRRLKRALVSTDALVEKKAGKTIAEIFRDAGEPSFRKLEQAVVAEVSQQNDLIVDCGGGVVLNPENLSALKKSGSVFYLQASPEVIYQRTKNEKHRPLLNTPDPLATIRELLVQREEFYRQADFTIDANDPSVEPVCREIIRIMKEKN